MTTFLIRFGAVIGWSAVAVTAAACIWAQVSLMRDRRNAARVRDKARHPATRNLTPTELGTARLIVFPQPTLPPEAEIIAAIRARAEADEAGLHERELFVEDVLRAER